MIISDGSKSSRHVSLVETEQFGSGDISVFHLASTNVVPSLDRIGRHIPMYLEMWNVDMSLSGPVVDHSREAIPPDPQKN
jgi:hypothetical protein